MNTKPFFGWGVVLVAMMFAGTLSGDDSKVKPEQDKVAQQNGEFKLPKRDEHPGKNPGFSLKQSLGDTGLKLAIVIGIFMVFVILLSKRKDQQAIPKEAIELLGRIPFSNKQSIQLIKFGKKLVLVEASSAGLKPISEITDPSEVDQMVQMIRPSK